MVRTPIASSLFGSIFDATFAFTRRGDGVPKEAYYTMPGLLPDGSREVLCVMNHPTEGASLEIIG